MYFVHNSGSCTEGNGVTLKLNGTFCELILYDFPLVALFTKFNNFLSTRCTCSEVVFDFDEEQPIWVH